MTRLVASALTDTRAYLEVEALQPVVADDVPNEVHR